MLRERLGSEARAPGGVGGVGGVAPPTPGGGQQQQLGLSGIEASRAQEIIVEYRAMQVCGIGVRVRQVWEEGKVVGGICVMRTFEWLFMWW